MSATTTDFHVPEVARLRSGPMGSDPSYGNNGAFLIPSVEPGWQLAIIASDGTDSDVPEADGWEHVSVRATRRLQSRVPTWKEMAYVKGVFWDPEVVVMQLHPRQSQYVNNHPHVLHLWRPRHAPIPEPPASLVGTL